LFADGRDGAGFQLRDTAAFEAHDRLGVIFDARLLPDFFLEEI